MNKQTEGEIFLRISIQIIFFFFLWMKVPILKTLMTTSFSKISNNLTTHWFLKENQIIWMSETYIIPDIIGYLNGLEMKHEKAHSCITCSAMNFTLTIRRYLQTLTWGFIKSKEVLPVSGAPVLAGREVLLPAPPKVVPEVAPDVFSPTAPVVAASALLLVPEGRTVLHAFRQGCRNHFHQSSYLHSCH